MQTYCSSKTFKYKVAKADKPTKCLKLMALPTNGNPGFEKLTAKIIGPSLTYNFNLSLLSGIYINKLKRAHATPIYKSGNKTKCENYRPISILPITSKVYDKEVFQQVYSYLTDDLLSKHQSDSRRYHLYMSFAWYQRSISFQQ